MINNLVYSTTWSDRRRADRESCRGGGKGTDEDGHGANKNGGGNLVNAERKWTWMKKDE